MSTQVESHSRSEPAPAAALGIAMVQSQGETKAAPTREGGGRSAAPLEIRLYSHSSILYWWPVWAVGFLMALLTYVDGGRLVYLPPDTIVEGNRIIVTDVTEMPHDRLARNPYLGTFFMLTIMIVFVFANVQLRGLWGWIAILSLSLALVLLTAYGLWGQVVDWFSVVHIHINLAGYAFLSILMLAVWALSVFLFDRRTYIIFSAGQVRVLDNIGGAEKVYDVTNMTFQVLPNVFFRHHILGFWGAGDIIVRTGGSRPETLEWPNVLFARSRIKQIQERLKSREVV